MACSGTPKRIVIAVTDHDIISSLPGEVKEKILTKLPIKDAVRTSILSTWASIPEIFVKNDDLVRMSENRNIPSFWEKDIVFEHLETVEILGFKASEPVLAFVKFILGSAPILRTLTLSEKGLTSKEQNPLAFKQLLKFTRASTKAKVVFA